MTFFTSLTSSNERTIKHTPLQTLEVSGISAVSIVHVFLIWNLACLFSSSEKLGKEEE